MKCSLGISNFLKEISSLSHSIVFLYFFAVITEEAFLISPCYSVELCIQMVISLLFFFAFHFSSFHSHWGPACEGSRETQRRNGVSDRFRERQGKNVEDKKIEERKRLTFLGLHRKPIKLRDKKFALFTEATGALLVSRGSEDAERLPVQVLETRADK